MGVVLQSMFTIIFIVEFITGNVGNGFIALVNFMDWVKRRKLSAVDRILSALAVSRITFLCALFLDWWLDTFSPASLMNINVLRMIFIVLTVTNHFSIWLATSLSILYFLKIAIFSNFLFLYLKWRFKKVVSAVLLVSLVILLMNVTLITIYIDILIEDSKRNKTSASILTDVPQFSNLLLFLNFMFTSIPFTASLVAFLLLIFSLWKHLKNVQLHSRGSRDASSTAHVKALQMVIAFLMLYCTFVLSLITEIWTFGIGKKLILSIARASIASFPSGHSFVLILGNTKLRQALFLAWRCMRYGFKEGEPVGS